MDAGIMEGLQYRLLTMTEKKMLGQFETSQEDRITLKSEIVARRTEIDGKKKLLVRWHPSDV